MQKLKLIVMLFIIWRLFLFMPLYLGDRFIPFDAINKDVRIWAYTRPYQPVASIFLYPWANFDGVHYLTVAGDGYRRGAEGRFFPFYPFLIFIFSKLLGGNIIYGAIQFITAFLIANTSFLLSLYVFYKLLRIDYSEKIAIWSILLLLAFPTSFFFGSIYSESIFLLLTLLSIYCIRKQKFFLASLLGSLLTLTRIVGVVILIPIFYEIIIQNKGNLLSEKVLKEIVPMLLIPLTLLGFMYFNYIRWHDWLYFIHAQQAVVSGRSHMVLFIPQTIYRYIKILLSVSPHQFEWWISLFEITIFFAAISFLFIAWRKKVYPSYILFSLCCLLIPSISGTFSGLPRYASVSFAIFIAFALLKSKILKVSILVICISLLFLSLIYFSRGYFIA